MSELLTAFSGLVAYLGDEISADGFINVSAPNANNGRSKYTINIRATPLSGAAINRIVRQLHANLSKGKETKGKFPPDVKAKIDAFLTTVAAGPADQKPELLKYMSEYDADDGGGMHGGTRSRSCDSRSRRSRPAAGGRRNRKTMKGRQRY